MANIEFFFDYGSPASYLAYTQMPGVAQRTGATVVYRPMLLGGVFKATGNQSPINIPAKGAWMMEDLPRFAKRYGVPYVRNPHFPINTLNLMRVAIAGAGAVGRSIAKELLGNGHEVLLIDWDPRAIKVELVPTAEWLLADACEIVIVRDSLRGEDHAVVAARLNEHWLLLDNRRMAMVEDGDARNYRALFVIDQYGLLQYADPSLVADIPRVAPPAALNAAMQPG